MAGVEQLRSRLRPMEVSGGAIRSLLSSERVAYLDERYLLFWDIANELEDSRLDGQLDELARNVRSIITAEYRNHDWKQNKVPDFAQVRSIVGQSAIVIDGNTTCNPKMKNMLTLDGVGGRVRISPMGIVGDLRSGPHTTIHGKLRLRPDGRVEDSRTGMLIEKLPREGLPDVSISDPDAQVTIGGRIVLNDGRQFGQECAQEWHMHWVDQRAVLVANYIQWPTWVKEEKVSQATWKETLSRMVATFNIEPMYFVAMSHDLGFRYAFPFFERFLYSGKKYELSYERKIDTAEDMKGLMREWLGQEYEENVSLLGNMLQMFRLRDFDVVQ